jgi:hypothetical protein
MDKELLAVLTKVAECGGMVDDPAKHPHHCRTTAGILCVWIGTDSNLLITDKTMA